MSKTGDFVCYGEILWDVFPEAAHLGGAPLNVALRLASLCEHTSVHIISAVGKDALGREALEEIKSTALSLKGVQENNYPTGSVKVQISEAGNANYTIKKEVAWDYIECTKEALTLLSNQSILIYGSLAMRSFKSFETAKRLIDAAHFTVFDVNLREPFYKMDSVITLMKRSDFIKMNDEELALICTALKGPNDDIKSQLLWLRDMVEATYLCVTLGPDGACVLHKTNFKQVKGYPTTVVDTVGAGDSFLATLLWALFEQNKSINESLQLACAMGAIVAGKAGANPNITNQQLQAVLSRS